MQQENISFPKTELHRKEKREEEQNQTGRIALKIFGSSQNPKDLLLMLRMLSLKER